MSEIKKLTGVILKFRDARNWKQFHNPKNVALSLVLEAAEVMEHFQWKNSDELTAHIEKNRGQIAEELADVLYWVLLMSNDLKIDISRSLKSKLKKNTLKYPVKRSKNRHVKYNQL